jgi:hypothetical protein
MEWKKATNLTDPNQRTKENETTETDAHSMMITMKMTDAMLLQSEWIVKKVGAESLRKMEETVEMTEMIRIEEVVVIGMIETQTEMIKAGDVVLRITRWAGSNHLMQAESKLDGIKTIRGTDRSSNQKISNLLM